MQDVNEIPEERNQLGAGWLDLPNGPAAQQEAVQQQPAQQGPAQQLYAIANAMTEDQLPYL